MKFGMKLIGGCLILVSLICALERTSSAKTPDGKRKLVLVAGKPSHPPRMHEFNAGTQLMAKCLKDVKDLQVEVVLNGWPKDEAVFSNADAVIFYMDGGGRHEVVLENGRRMKLVEEWTKRGVGIGCMHYGVEIVPDQAGVEFKRWIGGHYEHMFSCNPIWEPKFDRFITHPITQGVAPFQVKDEWYFNMRFVEGFDANGPAQRDGVQFWPILVAQPSDAVRDGPYVYPKGPYSHIQASKGRSEAMMWAIQRPDGGRGFGFTGGHFHDNWANDNYRKVVLNACVWLTGSEVPADGVVSKVSTEDLEANLDPKTPKK